ncbi:hypothetical protein N4308_14405, partial [Staphylococcus aureus]|uniref:hypothetical protein n=1 Tax=Staphylococcus aureus TaxID=1280 RepID=UPI0021B0DA5A
ALSKISERWGKIAAIATTHKIINAETKKTGGFIFPHVRDFCGDNDIPTSLLITAYDCHKVYFL